MKVITTVFASIMLMQFSASAQKPNHDLSFEIGMNQYDLIKHSDNNHFTKSPSGFSPTLGITYFLDKHNLPISVGMRYNMFKIDFHYINKGDFWEPKSIRHQSSYVQLQFPIGYHHQFKNMDLTAGLSPALYIGYKENTTGELPADALGQQGIISSSAGISYDNPKGVVMNCDAFFSITQYFVSIKNTKLGIKAYIHYPLLHNDNIIISNDFQFVNEKGNTFSYNATYRQSFKPLVYGLSLVLR